MAAVAHRHDPSSDYRFSLDGPAGTVTIAGRSHALGDVVSYEIETDEARDTEGQFLCGTIYGLTAGALLVAVLVGDLDWKFLVGIAFIGAIALMCMADGLAVEPVIIHRLVMQMRDGQEVTFTAAQWEPVVAIADRIDGLASRVHG